MKYLVKIESHFVVEVPDDSYDFDTDADSRVNHEAKYFNEQFQFFLKNDLCIEDEQIRINRVEVVNITS